MPRILIILILALFAIPSTTFAALDMQHLVREVEEQYNGRSSHSVTRMEVSTEHWKRTLEMEGWSLGRDYFLIRIIEPAKERDVATLKANRDVWNYLPKVDKTIKIPPSMMGGAWMGSHITNDDLVKANKIDEEYRFTLLEETEQQWVIEGIPHPDAAVIWGKILYRIERERRVPIEITYYDEEMVAVRSIGFSRVEEHDGRFIPMRMEVTPLDKPQERTIFEYDSIDFNISLTPDDFTLRALKRRR